MLVQRTQIYLYPEQHRALLKEAAQKGISLADAVSSSPRPACSYHLLGNTAWS